MEDQEPYAKSLAEVIADIESTLPGAQNSGYPAVSAAMSLPVAQELLKALKYYQEPSFYGWPLSLVELYLNEEEQIPEKVFSAYKEHINSLVEDNDTNESFFIDEAYDVDCPWHQKLEEGI